MDGIAYEGRMLFGIRELRVDNGAHQLAIGRAVRAVWTSGLLVGRELDGSLDSQWRVDSTLAGAVAVITTPGVVPEVPTPAAPLKTPGQYDHKGGALALDADGVPFELDATLDDATLAVPDDGVWRTVILRPVEVPFGEGKITLTAGDKTVMGTGTRFSRLTEPSAGVLGSKIVVGGTFAGVYQVESITSDTELELVAAPSGAGSETVRWEPGGDFTASPLERATWGRRVGTVELVTRAPVPPAGSFVLADVRRSAASSTCDVIDRRRGNVARRHRATVSGLALRREASGTSDVLWRRTLSTSSSTTSYGLCTRAGSGWVAVWGDTDASAVRRAIYDPVDETWSTSTIEVSGAQATAVTLPVVRSEVAVSPSHAAIMIEDDQVRVRYSIDQGTTFGSSSVILPATSATLSDPSAVVTKWGRIVVAYLHTDASVDTIRFIYSDDLGETWETNGGAGFLLTDNVLNEPPTRVTSLHVLADGRIATMAAALSINENVLIISANDSLPTPADPSSSATQIAIGPLTETSAVGVLPNGQILVSGFNETDGAYARILGMNGASAGLRPQAANRRNLFSDSAMPMVLRTEVHPKTGEVMVLYIIEVSPGVASVRSVIYEVNERSMLAVDFDI